MKRAIKTSILVHSSASRIWEVLMNVSVYDQWSPTIKPLATFPEVNKRIKVLLTQPNGFKITMNPIVLKKETDKELRWKGRLLVNGLFDGEHYFMINPIDEDTTEFIQGEYFSGLLIPFMTKMIDVDTLEGFKLFNQALKQRVESL